MAVAKTQAPQIYCRADIPRSQKYQAARIFTERLVLFNGKIYYMRVFYGGGAEFVSYDLKAQKWAFLCFG